MLINIHRIMINHNVLELLNCDIDFWRDGLLRVRGGGGGGMKCVGNLPDLRLLNVAAHMAVEKVK